MYFYEYEDNKKVNISSIGFERFVLRVLRDHLKSKNRTIIFSNNPPHLGYDFFLPEGIDEINKPTYIIVKTNYNLKSIKLDYEIKIPKFRVSKDFAIFVLNRNILSKDIYQYKNQLNESGIGDIWDLNEFKKRTGKTYDRYSKIIIDPKKYLIDNAIKNDSEISSIDDRKKTIAILKNEFAKDNITLFLGAGVSIDAKIPDWSSFVNDLYTMMFSKVLDKRKFDDQFKEQLNKLANSYKENNLIIQLRQIKTQFKNDEYFNIVKDILYKNEPTSDTEILKSIASMCKPRRDGVGVKSIITYNFDDLVESALLNMNVEINSISNESDETEISKLNIYHVHGFLPRLETYSEDHNTELIFSEEDYHRVYNDAYCWSNLVQLNHLREDVCIFIGCSLNDPNLRRLLDITYQRRQMKKHYAILRKPVFLETTRDITESKALNEFKIIDMNLKTIFYETIGLSIIWVNEYNEIPGIIKSICEK